MPPQKNYYDLLGLPPDASAEEIRRAYHDAARRLHPDVNKADGATEIFLQIQKAYDVLGDAKFRAEYDQKLAAENTDPVLTEILYSRTSITNINEPQLIYSLLEFSARKQAVSLPDPPINVCLVLDRSTSMQGERMDTVKTAAIELVRQLKPDDMLSIVVFSDRAEVLLSAGRRSDRSAIETQIRMLRPGGGTEIFQGLQAGYTEVQRYTGRCPINQIILLTDGRTYGDEDECLQLADRAAPQGIHITGLGIGTEWNDAFLDELAARTGGSSTYISRAKDIQSFLKEKFNSFSQIYAEQAALHIDLSPDVTLNSAFRLQPETAVLPTTIPIRLGCIPKTSKMSLLLEFIVPPLKNASGRLTFSTGELKMTLLSNPNANDSASFRLSRLIQDEPDTDLPPRPIFQALSQVSLYRMQERARKDVIEGKVQEASHRLQRLATQLISMGERELAQTALMEAERIQQTHVFSAEGEKKIKYGTRSLLLPARFEGKTAP